MNIDSLPILSDPQAMRLDPAEPVDIVYCWVTDNTDFQRERLRWLPPEFKNDDAAGNQRYREMDELRHSLRSVEKYAPWVRKIFIVTNGQIPQGLNFAHPRLQLVSHSEIFPTKQYLPTFSNRPVTSCLHRIPGLARWFLFFNDDVFLGAPLKLSNLYFDDSGKQKVMLSSIPTGKFNNLHIQAAKNTVRLVNFCFNSSNPVYPILHIPFLLNRDVLFALEDMFKDEYDKLRNRRFRTEQDILIELLYAHILLARKSFSVSLWSYRDKHNEYISLRNDYLPLGMIRMMRAVFNLARHRPEFICVNDEMSDNTNLWARLQMFFLRLFYRLYYPQPSSWELTNE